MSKTTFSLHPSFFCQSSIYGIKHEWNDNLFCLLQFLLTVCQQLTCKWIREDLDILHPWSLHFVMQFKSGVESSLRSVVTDSVLYIFCNVIKGLQVTDNSLTFDKLFSYVLHPFSFMSRSLLISICPSFTQYFYWSCVLFREILAKL